MSERGIKEALTMSKRNRLAIHFALRFFDGFHILGV